MLKLYHENSEKVGDIVHFSPKKIAASVLIAAICSSSAPLPIQAAEEPLLLYQVTTGKIFEVEATDEFLQLLTANESSPYQVETLEGHENEQPVDMADQDYEMDENLYLVVNLDTDGNGVADLNIDTNGDGIPDLNIDLDGDGVPDCAVDADGDGITDEGSPELPAIGDSPEDEIDTPQDQDPSTTPPPVEDSTAEYPSQNGTESDSEEEGSSDETTNNSSESDEDNASEGEEPEETESNDDGDISETVPGEAGNEIEEPAEEENGQDQENESFTEENEEPQVTPEEPSEPTVPESSQEVPVTPPSEPPTISIAPPSLQTPAESTIEDSVVYKGPLKSWSGVDLHSNRYKLKAAAEAMLGWHYSQAIRMTYGYRDCSSFVYTAISDAGFAPPVSWAWTTYTMPSYTDIVYQIPMSDLRPGDIILGDGHVAFYWGNDAFGSPMTLECCGTFGVCYGYMMCNGWDFPYTSAWRIRGIDGTDPNYVGTNGTASSNLTPSISQSGSQDSGEISSHGSDQVAVKTVVSELEETQSIVVTPDKLNGNVIDLLDLEIDPIFTLQMYLDKYMEQIDLQNLQNMTDQSEQLRYLIGIALKEKGIETGQILTEYVGEELDSPKVDIDEVLTEDNSINVVSLM